MKVKKLLSIILSISYIFSSIIQVQVLAADDYCAAKNSKGGYLHPRCANPELAKVWNNQDNFTAVKNLGPDGDDEYYCFNFRALDDVFEERKLEPTGNLWKEYDALSKFCYPPFLNLKTALAVCVTSFIGGLGGYFFPKSTKNIKSQSSGLSSGQNSGGTSAKISRTPSLDDLTLKEHKPRRSVFPACIGALISGLASFIGLYVNYNVDKIMQTLREKRSKENCLIR